MNLTYVLKEKCPKCGREGQYGNINMSSDTLNRGCNGCGYRKRISLPSLNKTVLYLDQCFFSHAFRNNDKRYVEAAQRIEHLASSQLLVCPYSSTHTEETHLWRHAEQENLYKFIKQTARGRQFLKASWIKEKQLYNSFNSYLKSDGRYFIAEERDAFQVNIHSWDDYFWIDIRPCIDDPEVKRQVKKYVVAELVAMFEGWRKTADSFEDDRRTEATGYAESPLFEPFIRKLMYIDENEISVEHRTKRIKSFLKSDYFVNTPHIDISCQLFAVLRKLVRNGAYPNQEKAKEKLAGLFYDVDSISTFGPYCDAIFVDREMKSWIADKDANICKRYSFSVFSADSWDDFLQYLDNIEEKKPKELDMFLQLAYYDNWNVFI